MCVFVCFFWRAFFSLFALVSFVFVDVLGGGRVGGQLGILFRARRRWF